MTGKFPLIGALALVVGLFLPASALAYKHDFDAKRQDWSFAGVFGKYDPAQLQRGFQVFLQSCAACHGARLLAFRNLSQPGGPEFTEGQIKALAAEYMILDEEVEGGERAGIPADRWPSPFANALEAKQANSGALPPDFSVIAKARALPNTFPWWIVDYFTTYQEGGPDYIYNMLVNYADAPDGVEVDAGQFYNAFTGTNLAMPPPLFDGVVEYEGGAPATVDQYARDVSAFLMWVAEPGLTDRKQLGFKVILFLLLFAGLLYLVKRRIWRQVPH
ncbi:MAG: cytochrome c1 [Alphaproteobacteria bacterium]|nr:cytochrome c1 [Alphaproteobacteria bacterium]